MAISGAAETKTRARGPCGRTPYAPHTTERKETAMDNMKLYHSISHVQINNDFADDIAAAETAEAEHMAWLRMMIAKAKMWDAIASDERNSKEIRISAAARRNALSDLIVLWKRNF